MKSYEITLQPLFRFLISKRDENHFVFQLLWCVCVCLQGFRFEQMQKDPGCKPTRNYLKHVKTIGSVARREPVPVAPQ